MLDLLRAAGFSVTRFFPVTPRVEENDVDHRAAPAGPQRHRHPGVDVIGECRDVTTTIEDRGPVQSVVLD